MRVQNLKIFLILFYWQSIDSCEEIMHIQTYVLVPISFEHLRDEVLFYYFFFHFLFSYIR